MTVRPEAAPTNFRHYVSLTFGAGGTMLDVGLVVVGTLLLGLAVAVILDGLDLVSVGLGLSTGAMLGSGLVIGIVGGFALGVASEGPLGRGRRLVGYEETQVLVARIVASIVVGLVFLLIHNFLTGPASDLPSPFQIGVDSLRAVATAGMTAVPLFGVPLAWWIRSGGLGESMALDGDIPILYFVWAITTMVLL